jgi:hypothetical protein
MPYFLFKFFLIFFSKQRKTLFKMATLTFRVSDHIFFICYLKNQMTFFWGFWSKLFGNILKMLRTNFLKSPTKNIANATLYLF